MSRALRNVAVIAIALLLVGCDDETTENTTTGGDTGGSAQDGGETGVDTDPATGDTGQEGDTDLPTDQDVTDGDVPQGDITAGDGLSDTGDVTNGDTGDPTDMTRLEYCMGDGPPIIVSDNGGQGTTTVCTGNIAQVSFRYGICTCEDITYSNIIETDAFDSSLGPYMAPGTVGGSVGANGQVIGSNRLDIGGSLWIGSTGGLAISNEANVALELRDNGPLSSAGAPVNVGADAWINGDVSGTTMTIGGDLVVPQAATVSVPNLMLTGNEVRQAFTVPPPCDCAESQLVDIASFVSYYETNNDNAEIGLDPDLLVGSTEPVELELDCGRFYLSGISNANSVVIRANARTALFIGGDITTSNAFSVELAEGAELDIFVAGTFTSSNRVDLGSVDNPANVRLYIGTDQDITWSNQFTIGGNVYAPRARLSVSNELEVFGSIFVRALNATNRLTVHYDRAVLNAGADCDDPPPTGMDMTGVDMSDPPPTTCSDCRDCGNQACIGGECGACTDSSQCCSPLLCIQGTCAYPN